MLTNNQLIRLHHALLQGASICTDSRTAQPGSIFFALTGEHFDGNAFAASALKNGSSIAVVNKQPAGNKEQYIVVNDVLAALHQFCRYHRDSLNIPVIGITGSNGKTTTKELISSILSQRYLTTATKGNLNNHIGVPLTILSVDKQAQMSIVEMGANHLGEIDQLCSLAQPDYGIITSLGKAHLEGFGSFENVITAKTELYRHIMQRQGVLFVPGDHEILSRHAKPARSFTYGKGEANDCIGKLTGEFPFLSIDFKVQKDFGKAVAGMHGHVSSQLYGAYNFDNIMAAVTIGLYFGVSPGQIAEAVVSYVPQNNRSQIMRTKRNTILLDAYNANPSSMAAALSHFASYTGRHNTAVMLGDMFELGKYALQEHKDIFDLAQKWHFGKYLFVGKHFASVAVSSANTFVCNDITEAAAWLQNNPLEDHHILIKGSRAVTMESLVPYL